MEPERSSLKVVITHDFMETYGGAERVLAEMAKAFPDAPVVAILGRDEVAARAGVADRFTSLLPQRESLLRHYRLLTPVFPALVDRLRIPDADVVLSSSYAFAHRLRPAGDAVQVCYCHSPLRFAWTMTESYANRWGREALSRRAFGVLAARMRESDRRAAARVDHYLTQSRYTARQIRTFYDQEPEIIGAPVDCRRFAPSGAAPGDHYVFCARLIEPYKQCSLVLEAFRRLPHERLVIAGDGPAAAELRAAAPPNVTFVGHLGDDALVETLQSAKALLFPSLDDFGLMPLEAMACGRPVLAYGAGGALHTVRPGVTGELFDEQTPEALVAAIAAFDAQRYDPAAIRAHAMHWDSARFRDRVRRAVMSAAGVLPEVLVPVGDTVAPTVPVRRTGRFDRTPAVAPEPPAEALDGPAAH